MTISKKSSSRNVSVRDPINNWILAFARMTRSGMTIVLVFGMSGTWASQVPQLPHLPMKVVDTAFNMPVGGNVHHVNAGDDLQDAINSAALGDIIILEAGAVFKPKSIEEFILPDKGPGDKWIYIISSELAQLPKPGTRVKPSDKDHMPKITVNGQLSAIRTDFKAHHYRFVGIEVESTSDYLYSLIYTGLEWDKWDLSRPDSISQLPTDIIFDRCYIHGTLGKELRIGVNFNGNRMGLVDSYIEEVGYDGKDTIGVQVWNGLGPYRVVNNFIESTGINMMFGGDDPTIQDLVPSDIEILGNHFHKKYAWKDDPEYDFEIKNSFELKNAKRVLIEGNIFEYNWYDAQYGPTIVFTVRNQSGGAPWSHVDDVIFRKNIIRNAAGGINILSMDYNYPSQKTERMLIQDNLFYNIDYREYGNGGGRFISLNSSQDPPILHLVVDHNTMVFRNIGGAYMNVGDAFATAAEKFVLTNNIIAHGDYGFHRIAGKPIDMFFPDFNRESNVFITRPVDRCHQHNYCHRISDGYSDSNFFEFMDTGDPIGFTNMTMNHPLDFVLKGDSPYKNAALDNKDMGADIGALWDAVKCVEAGTCDPLLNEPEPEEPENPEVPESSPDPKYTNKDLTKKYKNIFNPKDDKILEIQCVNQINIYDRHGNLVKSLMCSGESVVWDGDEAPSGIYVIHEEDKEPRKVVVIK